jgi:hypothetical protein
MRPGIYFFAAKLQIQHSKDRIPIGRKEGLPLRRSLKNSRITLVNGEKYGIKLCLQLKRVFLSILLARFAAPARHLHGSQIPNDLGHGGNADRAITLVNRGVDRNAC